MSAATVLRLTRNRVAAVSREYAATWLEVDLCEVELGEAGLCMLPRDHSGSCLPIPEGYEPHTHVEQSPGFADHLRESVNGALTTAGFVGCLFAWYGLAAVMHP